MNLVLFGFMYVLPGAIIIRSSRAYQTQRRGLIATSLSAILFGAAMLVLRFPTVHFGDVIVSSITFGFWGAALFVLADCFRE